MPDIPASTANDHAVRWAARFRLGRVLAALSGRPDRAHGQGALDTEVNPRRPLVNGGGRSGPTGHLRSVPTPADQPVVAVRSAVTGERLPSG